MPAGKPGEGVMQIVTLQKRDAHAGQGLGGPGQICIGGQKAAIEQRDVGVRGKLPDQGVPLFDKDRAGQPGVLNRIVDAVADDLVILDQPVIGVGGIGEWREEQRIDTRRCQDPEVGRQPAQAGQIVVEDVVAEDETGIPSEGIEIGKSVPVDPPAGWNLEGLLPADRADGIDDVLLIDFDVEEKGLEKQVLGRGWH